MGSPRVLNDRPQNPELAVIAWVRPRNLRARADTNDVMTRLSQLPGKRPLVDTFTDPAAACVWLL